MHWPMNAFIIVCLLVSYPVHAEPPARKTKTENILFVMLDGFRWQELFCGAEEELLDKDRGGVQNVEETKKLFGERHQRSDARLCSLSFGA